MESRNETLNWGDKVRKGTQPHGGTCGVVAVNLGHPAGPLACDTSSPRPATSGYRMRGAGREGYTCAPQGRNNPPKLQKQ